jgi:hypothetical protein
MVALRNESVRYQGNFIVHDQPSNLPTGRKAIKQSNHPTRIRQQDSSYLCTPQLIAYEVV